MQQNNATGRNWKRLLRLWLVALCLALPLTGGWCERYKEQNTRTDRMRHYYDSVLRAERLRKDSVSRALRRLEQQQKDTLRRE